MSKRKWPKGWLIDPQQVNTWLDKVANQMRDENFKGVIQTCKRILRYLPKKDPVRAETLGYMGTAYAVQKDFENACQTFDQAIEINPEDSYLWFNYGLACLHTSRSGKSVGALERAVHLEGNGEMADRFVEQLAFCQKIAQSEIALRGPDFSMDLLIEQQELFQQGIQLLSQSQWKKAEVTFQKAIALGDCLPQPWGNLGLSLMMQKRFDEAEAAYQRALEIDPEYELAQINIEKLAYMRETPDFEPEFRISSPFDDMKTSLTIIEED
jgi:tetratricopeptide (TPR) repeat protein